MPVPSVLLVIVSCFLHAWWNFVLKKAGGTTTFVALSKISEVVLFGIPFLVVLYVEKSPVEWGLVVVGAALTLLNYVFLGKAYGSGNLSVAYPIARAGALVLLPVAGWLWQRERLSPAGVGALALIIAGVFLIQLRSFRNEDLLAGLQALGARANIFAGLAAAMVAAYTLWDQHAVRRMNPFVYFYAYTLLVAAAYGIKLVTCEGISIAREEWRRNRSPILQVGLLNTVTYLLVLLALKDGSATYTIALRQLSIAFGAVLGWVVLREEAAIPKRIGVGLLVVGCIATALFRM